MPKLELSHTFSGCAAAVEEVERLKSIQFTGANKGKKLPPPPMMSEAEASAIAAREGLTLVKGPTNSGYTGVGKDKRVYTGRAESKNRLPYKVYVKRGVGVGGNDGGDRRRVRPRQGQPKARRVTGLYLGSFSSAHEAALVYARHLGAEQSAEVARESARCGSCSGCKTSANCGECQSCFDRVAAGGSVARTSSVFGQNRSSCVQRACCNPREAGALDEWSRQKPVLKRAVELLVTKGVRATPPPPPPPATPCSPPAAPCSQPADPRGQPAAPCSQPAAPRIPGPQLAHDARRQGSSAGAMRGGA